MAEIPEHPDLAKERKTERWALAFALAAIGVFFGAMMIGFASYAKYVYWKGRLMPADVEASINQEFAVGYWVTGIGVAATVACYVVWLFLRRRARASYEL